MKKYIILLSLGLFSVASWSQNAEPEVIPSVQKWVGGDGEFSFSQQTECIAKSRKLRASVQLFEQELPQAVKNTQGTKNKIYFALTKENLPEEGYIINIQKDQIKVSARTEQGIFWATRTLLQMLSHGQALPVGKITDFPSQAKRGFMLDVGRKFFSMDYLEKYVKLLSYYKMNEFQIHLNDNGFPQFFDNDWAKTYAAFRLESDYFPALTAKDGHYTKKEFRVLQELGQKYNVNIIPEIDVPAHSLSFTHLRPALATEKYGRDHLDLYKPETYQFIDSLFAEYIGGKNPVFIGKDFHIGTDEYNKKETEKFREFTDRYIKYVQKFGKNPRIWGSFRMLKGKTPVSSKGVVMNAWNDGWSETFEAIQNGNQLINTCDAYLYIVPATGYYYDFLNEKWLYQNWTAQKINPKEDLAKDPKALLGGMFAVWNDHVGNGISQQDVHYRTLPALKVMAQKLWNESPSRSFPEFQKIAQKLGEAPTVQMGTYLPSKDSLVLHYKFNSEQEKDLSPNQKYHEVARQGVKVASDALEFIGKSAVETPVGSVGYNYEVKFELNLSPETPDGAILFSDDQSKIFLTKGNDGAYRLGFSRDGYTYHFQNPIPTQQWVAISVQGDYKSTSLTLPGRKETLTEEKRLYPNKNGRTSPMYHQKTLFFPLQYIGDKQNSFVGKLRNLYLYHTPQDTSKLFSKRKS